MCLLVLSLQCHRRRCRRSRRSVDWTACTSGARKVRRPSIAPASRSSSIRRFGIALPRRAINQSEFGDATRGNLRRGDSRSSSPPTHASYSSRTSGWYEGDGVMIDASKRHGRVRRDNLDDPFWIERFMFARRVLTGVDDTPIIRNFGRDSHVRADRADGGQAAIRVLETIAGELLRRPQGRQARDPGGSV